MLKLKPSNESDIQGHLEEWFRTFGICAFPGCLHKCVLGSTLRKNTGRKSEEHLNKLDFDVKPAEIGDGTMGGTETMEHPLMPSGNNLFCDADNVDYYRTEDGTIRKLPDVFSNLLVS